MEETEQLICKMILIPLIDTSHLLWYYLPTKKGGLSRMLIQIVFGHVISGTLRTVRGVMPSGSL